MQRPQHALTPPPFLLLALLLGGFGWALAVPVWDSDFWWHLASGRWIWQAGALPESDPFGVFDNQNPIRSATVLQGQWLGQVLYYGIYQLGGANAIAALRVALLLATLLLLYDRLRRAGTGLAGSLAVVAVTGFCLQAYTGDRPQLLSIFFAALTFRVVERAMQQRTPRPYLPLLPLALLWSNVHGGVVLVALLLVLYAAVHGWRCRASHDGERRAALPLLGAAVLFAIATLFSPNGQDAYAYILNLQGSELQARTSEYVSALKLYQLGRPGLQAWVGLVLLLSLASLPGLWRRQPEKALPILLLIALAIESFRYFVFLLVIAMPWVAEGLQPWAARVMAKASAATRSMLATSIVIAALALLLIGQWGVPRGGVDEQRYPVEVLRANPALQGRVFDFMNWGGYLLWHAPGVKPYVDGRMLDDQRLTPYTHMLWASPRGQVWFERQGFDWVLIPYYDQHGEIYGLNRYLAHHPAWRLQAQHGNDRLYARRGGQRDWQTGQ